MDALIAATALVDKASISGEPMAARSPGKRAAACRDCSTDNCSDEKAAN